jgi:hypothetical protein
MSQYDAVGTLYIPLEEWHEWLQKRFPHLQDGQYVLGTPKESEEDIEIPYAKGTHDVHPNEWAEKPDWMKNFNKGSK